MFYINKNKIIKNKEYKHFIDVLKIIKQETEEKLKSEILLFNDMRNDTITIPTYLILRFEYNINHQEAYNYINNLNLVQKKSFIILLKRFNFSVENSIEAVLNMRTDNDLAQFLYFIRRNLPFDVAVNAIGLTFENSQNMFQLILQGVEADVARTSCHQNANDRRVMVYMVQHGYSSAFAESVIEDEDYLDEHINSIIDFIDNGITNAWCLETILKGTETDEIELVLNLLRQQVDINEFIRQIDYDDDKFAEMIQLVKENIPFEEARSIVLY